MTHVTIAGATGVIGKHVCELLNGRSDVDGRALVRRTGVLPHGGRLTEVLFTFDKPEAYVSIGSKDWPCDVLFCCIGSTMAAAGSQAAFAAIERDIPLRLIEAVARNNPRCRFVFISSMGAGKPVGFYLETKATVERAIMGSGLPYVILRPSLLMGGSRPEFRPGERFSQILLPALFKPFDWLGGRNMAWVGRYRPIEARVVAEAAVRHGLPGSDGKRLEREILEGWDLYE